MTDGAVPAQDLASEKAVLGGLMLLVDPMSVSGVIARGLREDDFYREQHGLVYRACCSLADRQAGVDHLTIMAELDRLGLRGRVTRGDVEELAGWVPVAGNVGQYADIVMEKARWRRRLTASFEMQAAAMTENEKDFARASAMLEFAAGGARTESYSPEQWAALMFDHFSQTNEQIREDLVSLPWPRLSAALGGGLGRGEVLIVGGPTEHGKSVVGDQILDRAYFAHSKRPHLYMTEMTAIARGMRYIARRSGVPYLRQRSGDLSAEQRKAIIKSLSEFGFGVTIAADWAMEDVVRDALRARYDVVCIDLVHGFHYEDERGLDRLSKQLQKLARVSTTLDGHPGTAVIGIVHLKEEGTRNGQVPRPTITSIKGGSSVKQDADFVMFVWQEQDANGDPAGEGEIWIAKGRGGAHAKQEVVLNSTRFRFESKGPEELQAAAPAADAGTKEEAPF